MHIKPFKGYRPIPELASKVALIPNNLMNEPDRKRAHRNNPYSFAHVIKPRLNFPEHSDRTDQQLFDFARNYFEKLVMQGVLVRDAMPCFYLYRMTMDGRSQTGLISVMNIRDYDDGLIKKHEHTRAEKELENLFHIENTKLNSNPVFLAYRTVTEIDQLLEELSSELPAVCDFISDFGVQETLWVIQDPPLVERIVSLFDRLVPAAYIADGHHRAAACSRFNRMMLDQKPDPSAPRDYAYFLTCLFPADQLCIFDYNRIVRSLNGLTEKTFLGKVREKFDVEPARTIPYQPNKPHRFGMYLAGTWYRLKALPGTYPDDLVGKLDVSILQENLLGPILSIHDPRTDKNIDFMAGNKDLTELEKRVDKGKADVAFSLFPVSMDELMEVSDAGLVMPPKSTWFEPKLLSGLVIFRMEF